MEGERTLGKEDTEVAAQTCCRACARPLRVAAWLARTTDHAAVLAEADAWWKLLWPLLLTSVARLSLPVIDAGFVGHLGTLQLAGASLAGVWINVTSGWVWPSFGAAVNTLSSQAMGAGNPRLAGVWLQTGLLLVTVAAAPIAVAWWFSEPVYLAANFAAAESELAGRFARWYLISLWPSMWYIVLGSFLNAQGVVLLPMVINVTMTGLNVLFNLFFIHGTQWAGGSAAGLGFVGSPLATGVSSTVCVAGLLGLLVVNRQRNRDSSLHKTWRGCACNEALQSQRLWEFGFKFVLPLALGNLLEELQLQVVAFLAAELGTVQLAAHSTMMNLYFFLTSVMFSAVSATQVRIAHHLGARRVDRAKLVMWIDVIFSTSCAIGVAIMFLVARGDLARMFSSDPRVWDEVGSLAVLVGCAYFVISAFYVAIAVLNAMGHTTEIAASFVAGAWVVAVPLAYVLTHVAHQGLVGLWIAMVSGYVIVTACALIALVRADWHKASEAAAERSRPAPDDTAGLASALLHPQDGTDDTESASGGPEALPSSDRVQL